MDIGEIDFSNYSPSDLRNKAHAGRSHERLNHTYNMYLFSVSRPRDNNLEF